MQSRREELHTLVNTALNLENIVDFKALHKLLHEIVNLLEARDDIRAIQPNVGQTNTTSEPDGIEDFVWNNNTENSIASNLVHSVNSLRARIESLEDSMRNQQVNSQINIASRPNDNANHHSKRIYPNGEEKTVKFIADHMNAANYLGSEIIEEEIEKVVSRLQGGQRDGQEGGQHDISREAIQLTQNTSYDRQFNILDWTTEDEDDSTNRIMQSTPPEGINLRRNSNSISATFSTEDQWSAWMRQLSQSSGLNLPAELRVSFNQPNWEDTLTKRLKDVEVKCDQLHEQLEAMHDMRDQLRDKLSIGVFDSVVVEWRSAATVADDRSRQEKNEINCRIDRVSECLVNVLKATTDQVDCLKKFMANELLSMEKQLQRIQRRTPDNRDHVEAAGGKNKILNDMTCISCNRYVAMRVREPYCLSSIVAEPLLKTTRQPLLNPCGPAKASSDRKTSAPFRESSRKSFEKRLAGGKHTIISSHDKQSYFAMEKEIEGGLTEERLICVDTEKQSGERDARILGGIVSGILASRSNDNQID